MTWGGDGGPEMGLGSGPSLRYLMEALECPFFQVMKRHHLTLLLKALLRQGDDCPHFTHEGAEEGEEPARDHTASSGKAERGWGSESKA